jgi:uncharacterized protein
MLDNIYEFSVETMVKRVDSLIVVLQTVQKLKSDKNLTDEDILSAKLAPDMLPLVKQIQITSDTLKATVAKLAGIEPPSYQDNEISIDELIERLQKTLVFVGSVDISDLKQGTNRTFTIPRYSEKSINSDNYLRDYGLPNFFFHVVIAYGILRMLGFELGKVVYINSLELNAE